MLVLPAELTQAQASACLQMLAQALRALPDEVVVVDAGALEKFDTSALAVLLECRRQARTLGKTFGVRRLPARLRELAGLYGVGELLPASP